MKLHKDYKIERACGKDLIRPSMRDAYLKGETLQATDGKMLAIVPIQRETGDYDGFISSMALRRAKVNRHNKTKTIRAGKHLVGFEDKELGNVRMKREDVRFLDGEEILNGLKKVVFKIKLNARLLLSLAQAMGAEDSCVKLEFTDGEGASPNAVRVTPLGGHNKAVGLLMPLKDV